MAIIPGAASKKTLLAVASALLLAGAAGSASAQSYYPDRYYSGSDRDCDGEPDRRPHPARAHQLPRPSLNSTVGDDVYLTSTRTGLIAEVICSLFR